MMLAKICAIVGSIKYIRISKSRYNECVALNLQWQLLLFLLSEYIWSWTQLIFMLPWFHYAYESSYILLLIPFYPLSTELSLSLSLSLSLCSFDFISFILKHLILALLLFFCHSRHRSANIKYLASKRFMFYCNVLQVA